MTLLEIMEKRHATKEYVEGPELTDDQLNKIVKAANLAPSPNNFQNTRILVVKSKEKLAEYSKFFQATNAQNVEHATALFIIIGQTWPMMKENNGKRIYDNDVHAYKMDEQTKENVVKGEIGYYDSMSEYTDVIDIYSSAIQFAFMDLEATDLGFASGPMLGVNKSDLEQYMIEKGEMVEGERANMYFTIGYEDTKSEVNKFHDPKTRIRKPVKDIYKVI